MKLNLNVKREKLRLDKRVAKIEGMLGQMDKRLNHIEGRLNWMLGAFITMWVTIVSLLIVILVTHSTT
jgi:hypothetical protein